MFLRPETFDTLTTWCMVLKWVSLHMSICCKFQRTNTFFIPLACISQEHVAGLLSTGLQVRKKNLVSIPCSAMKYTYGFQQVIYPFQSPFSSSVLFSFYKSIVMFNSLMFLKTSEIRRSSTNLPINNPGADGQLHSKLQQLASPGRNNSTNNNRHSELPKEKSLISYRMETLFLLDQFLNCRPSKLTSSFSEASMQAFSDANFNPQSITLFFPESA